MAQLRSLSINGNSVTDYVIAEGDTSSNTPEEDIQAYNFRFRKWASGLLEVWYTFTRIINYDQLWSDEIRYKEVNFNTPKEVDVPAFVRIDHIEQTLYGYTGGGLYSICPATGFGINEDGTLLIKNYVICFSTTAQTNKNIGISNYFVGTWK